MASLNPNTSLQIHELCRISPPPSSPKSSFSLTFFDLLWLRFHPVERLFFFSVPHLLPSSFFDSILPKLKLSLSLTLHHFLPLAGNIVWPSDSPKPIIQYNPGDSVSFTIAISDSDFTHVVDNSPCDASQSRAFVPNLDSSDSFASVISLQVTLFPNSGFCIGMSSHHACLDGKSSTMFIKAWAYQCRTQTSESESSVLLPPELQPFLEREAILDPRGIADAYIKGWSALDPNQKKQSLRILSEKFMPKVEGSARATFELKHDDIKKIKERVLQKWDDDDVDKRTESTNSKPTTLSTYVITASYVLFCLAKALERSEQKVAKIFHGFLVDCRRKLEPPIPETYVGNCVMAHVVEIRPEELKNEDAVVIAAKKIQRKISSIQNEKGARSRHILFQLFYLFK